MNNNSAFPNRRAILILLGALPIIQAIRVKAGVPQSAEARLERALSDINVTGGRLDLVRLHEAPDHMRAIIRLHWAPGTRTQPFVSVRPSEAVDDIVAQARDWVASLT